MRQTDGQECEPGPARHFRDWLALSFCTTISHDYALLSASLPTPTQLPPYILNTNRPRPTRQDVVSGPQQQLAPIKLALSLAHSLGTPPHNCYQLLHNKVKSEEKERKNEQGNSQSQPLLFVSLSASGENQLPVRPTRLTQINQSHSIGFDRSAVFSATAVESGAAGSSENSYSQSGSCQLSQLFSL